jgi:hypothetical protein
MTQHASNTSEADEIGLVAGYGTAVAMTRTRQSTIRSHHATAPGAIYSGKETTMTRYSSNANELDEIDFTTGYGTAVAVPRTRRSAVGSVQEEALGGSASNVTSPVAPATGSDDGAGGADSSQADDSAPMSPPAARRSIRLAAARGPGKGRRSQPQPPRDTNRRRKAA